MGNSCSVDKKKNDAVSPKNTYTRSSSTSKAGGKTRVDLTLRGREEKKLYQFAAFSPAIAHWELVNNQDAAMGNTVKPYCWSFDTALLFVDISGFTNLSTRLEVDALQRHINLYFTSLIDVIVAHGGDVLRFAGDAIMCSWSLSPHYTNDPKILRLAALAACRCALDLNKRCAIYHIPEVDATLKIHSGIGVGAVHAFRVGLPTHWEFFVAGEAVFQYAQAEQVANAGDAVCSPETWEMVKSELEGTVLDNGCVLLINEVNEEESIHMKLLPISANVIDPELKVALCAHDQLVRQRAGNSSSQRARAATSITGVPILGANRAQSLASMKNMDTSKGDSLSTLSKDMLHGGHLAPLQAYTHKVARSAVEQGVLRDIAEQRSVVVSFALIEGIDQALLAGLAGLDSVQACMEASLKAIEARGGMLRQFIRDDKGAVVIWSYGLTQQSFVDSPERALRTALDVISALKALELQPKVGVTSGTAYCGLVGASYRSEYALMGPAVNLAARLMCKCEKLEVELLCNDELHDKFMSSENNESFDFEAFPPMQVKGYTHPVSFYHPVLKASSKRESGSGLSKFMKRKSNYSSHSSHRNSNESSASPHHRSSSSLISSSSSHHHHHHHHVGFDDHAMNNSRNKTPSKTDDESRRQTSNSPPRNVRAMLGFKPAARKSHGGGAQPRKSDSQHIRKASSPHRSHIATTLVNETNHRGSGGRTSISSRGSVGSNRRSQTWSSPQPRRDSEGLRQSVLSHLDQLSLSHQMILKTAAAIGVVFDRSVLVNTYPGSAAEADQALAGSLANFVVRLQGDTQHDVRFAFRSAATASVIYELMLQAQRKRLHQQIAAWYERVRVLRRREGLRTEEDLIAPLALHYLLSGDEDRAKKLFVAAGRLSCSQGRYLEAVSHFDACLNLFTTRNGDDDDDVCCEVLVWLAQTIVRYAIPYKAPDFIENAQDLYHEDSVGGKKITDNTNSVNCAEKLLRRAFAVLNARIMRRVVARFRCAKLVSALDIWKINTKLSSRRPSLEHHDDGPTASVSSRRMSSQRFHLLRSNSMQGVSFISSTRSEIDIENQGKLTKRRLQLARVRSQLAWVVAADPDRCINEGDFIENSFREAANAQFNAGKYLDAADSMNGLGCYYHKRALLASPAVTAETIKADQKAMKVEKAKSMFIDANNNNISPRSTPRTSATTDAGGGVSGSESNYTTTSSSGASSSSSSSSSSNVGVSLFHAASAGEDALLNKRVSSGPTTEVTLDDEDNDDDGSQGAPHKDSFIAVKQKTDSAIELDKAYVEDHKLVVRRAITEKDNWLELARICYHKALSIRERLHVSPYLAQSFTSLGRLRCDDGEPVLGIEIFNAAVEQYFLTVGSHHPKVASSIEALAATYSRTNQPLMALGLRTQADAIREQQLAIEKSLGHDWSDSLPADMPSPNHGGKMNFNPDQEGGKGIRNSITQSQIHMIPSPASSSAADMKEELLPWESSGVTGPQGAWAQGFRPRGAKIETLPSLYVENQVKSPLQVINASPSSQAEYDILQRETGLESNVEEKDEKRNSTSVQRGSSMGRGESARTLKDWSSFSTAPSPLTDTATLFNANKHNKTPIPPSSILKVSTKMDPKSKLKRTVSHSSSKGSRRFSDAEVLSLYTQSIDDTPRPWLKNSTSTDTNNTPPVPPSVGTTSAAAPPPVPPQTTSSITLDVSPVTFCLKVVRGEIKGVSGDTLKKQLELLYPELGYFVGPSVEKSGLLANKAAAIRSEVITAMTWALKLADPQASKEKLGALVRAKCLHMDEKSEDMQQQLDQQQQSRNRKHGSGTGGSFLSGGRSNSGNQSSQSGSSRTGNSPITRNRSNSGNSARSLSRIRSETPDKKGTSLDVNVNDLNNQDNENLLIEKRAARALDGVLSMLALSSLGKVACLLGDVGLVPGGGGSSLPLSPSQFAQEVLSSVQQGHVSSPVGIDAHGIGNVEFPTMKRHILAATIDDTKLSAKVSSSTSSSNSSKFSGGRSSSKSSAKEKDLSPSLSDSSSSSHANLLLKCLSSSVDVRSIINGEAPASALLPLENCSFRKVTSTTNDNSNPPPSPKKEKKIKDNNNRPSPSRTRPNKNNKNEKSSTTVVGHLSLFGIPQLIFHDVLLAYAPTLAQGYTMSAACTSPFEEPMAMLQHVISMAHSSIEALLPMCEVNHTVTAFSVYSKLLTAACGRKSLPSQEDGGAAVCRIECMIENSAILDNIKVWKSSKVFTNQISRGIPSSSSTSRLKKKVQNKTGKSQQSVDMDKNSMKDSDDEEGDDDDFVEDVRTLIKDIVASSLNEIDINDRKHLEKELNLTGCAGSVNEWIADLNGETHDPDVPLFLCGCSNMIKVVLNAVLTTSKKEPTINLNKAASANKSSASKGGSNHRSAILNVLAAALEQICSISRSARHEIVTHQRLESTSQSTSGTNYLTERVLSGAATISHQVQQGEKSMITPRRPTKGSLSHLPHSPSALSSAFSSTLDNWLIMSNPYPVNCHCMVRCCELLVTQPTSSPAYSDIDIEETNNERAKELIKETPPPPPSSSSSTTTAPTVAVSSILPNANTPMSLAERLMIGLKCVRFNVTDSKADGSYAIVVAFDKEVKPVEHLLPKPPAGTKPSDRVRAAINLPPVSAMNKTGSPHHSNHHKHFPGGHSVDGGASVASRASSRRPSAILQEQIASANAEYPPTPTVIITSPGRGQGSEMVMVLARALVDLGILELKGVIANLDPVVDRAKLVRGTLDVLGLEKVPVGVGMTPWIQKSGDKAKTAEFNIEVKAPGYDYMLREPDVKDGKELLLSIYEKAEEYSVCLLCISALTDVAEFITIHKELFAEKTARVVMMGGVDEASIPPKPHTPEGTMDYLLPDKSAQNNQYDWDASELVHRTCQELSIQLVVSTRVAAYASAVPAFIYDELASIGHPVALRLRSTQEKSITGLWRRASLPPGHADRRGLPDRCDRKWFAKSFCGGADLSAVSADTPSIWSQVSAFNMYDPLALLMVDDRTSQAFFEPETKVVNGMEQLIVGVEKIPVAHDSLMTNNTAQKGSSGIKDVKALRDFLMDASRLGLMAAMPRAKFFRSDSFKTPFREKTSFIET